MAVDPNDLRDVKGLRSVVIELDRRGLDHTQIHAWVLEHRGDLPALSRLGTHLETRLARVFGIFGWSIPTEEPTEILTFAVDSGSETDLDLRSARHVEVDGVLYTITSRDTRRVILGTDRERKTYAFYTCEPSPEKAET